MLTVELRSWTNDCIEYIIKYTVSKGLKVPQFITNLNLYNNTYLYSAFLWINYLVFVLYIHTGLCEHIKGLPWSIMLITRSNRSKTILDYGGLTTETWTHAVTKCLFTYNCAHHFTMLPTTVVLLTIKIPW